MQSYLIEYKTAKIKAGQKKIVFTKTLENSIWENTELAKGNLSDEVNKLKNQSGKDDAQYFSFLSQDFNLKKALITNGFHTVEIKKEEFEKLKSPENN